MALARCGFLRRPHATWRRARFPHVRRARSAQGTEVLELANAETPRVGHTGIPGSSRVCKLFSEIKIFLVGASQTQDSFHKSLTFVAQRSSLSSCRSWPTQGDSKSSLLVLQVDGHENVAVRERQASLPKGTEPETLHLTGRSQGPGRGQPVSQSPATAQADRDGWTQGEKLRAGKLSPGPLVPSHRGRDRPPWWAVKPQGPEREMCSSWPCPVIVDTHTLQLSESHLGTAVLQRPLAKATGEPVLHTGHHTVCSSLK